MASASPNPFSTTFAPAAASDPAMAIPMPLVDPVTTAVLPVSEVMPVFLVTSSRCRWR